MEKPFDDLHAGIETQIWNLPAGIPDSDAVREAREIGFSTDGFLALGKALSRQLRYREAVQAYSDALTLDPENKMALRLRAGRYLTTMQSEQAIADFERCISLGAEKLDCFYRIGLAHYYAGRYEQAAEIFRQCMPLCDDEMGIAVIYWHTLSSCRAGIELSLLRQYHPGMEVGHHTAYERAMRTWAGEESWHSVLEDIEKEPDDMEYCIVLYALLYHPNCTAKKDLHAKLLRRNGFWPCFSYLAAWMDYNHADKIVQNDLSGI